jgi:hypothetical protein
MISKKTADDILDIIIDYVTIAQTEAMLEELSKVEGNESFRQSMTLLLKRHKEQHQ